MRVLPRITRPRIKSRRRKLWRRVSSLSVASVALSVNLLIFLLALLFILTGSRAAFLNTLGRHADLIASLLLLTSLLFLHGLLKRSVLPRIERHFFPTAYQERRIFLGLGQEARKAESIAQLYAAIALRIAESLEADNVSILVRDDVSGDYTCAAFSSRDCASQTSGQIESAEGQQKPKLKLAHDAFVVTRLRGLTTPLVIKAAEFETWERAFNSLPAKLREVRQQERKTLEQLKSHLLVQIRTKDQMVGILSLGLRRARFGYTTADRETLMSVAGQLALIIENSRLAERMVAQERLTRELALAAEVQRRLLPANPPQAISVELAGFCEPARGVGGDYYDFIAFDNQQLGIAIADVSGKGMPAALLMSTVQATLRSLSSKNGSRAQANESLTEMVAVLNRLLYDSTGGASYVTFFYGRFDQITHRLAYVNAGHNPPLFLRAGKTNDFKHLSSGGLIIGAFNNCGYEQEILQMQSGDLLFAFTDGLTEALNGRGEEFGEARVKQALSTNAGLTVNQIRDEIVRRVKSWCAGTPLYDDLTFVVMKVK